MTAESPAKLAMKYAIGKNCFHILRTRALGWWAARDHLLRSLSQVRGGTKIEVSHERFNWPKKFLSSESPSSMHSSGGLLYHALSPFIPTEFSLLADLINGAVWAKHTID